MYSWFLFRYGLPWGWPGWLNPNSTADKPGANPLGAFADIAVTANYTLQWLMGAKRVHGLDIGSWSQPIVRAAFKLIELKGKPNSTLYRFYKKRTTMRMRISNNPLPRAELR